MREGNIPEVQGQLRDRVGNAAGRAPGPPRGLNLVT